MRDRSFVVTLVGGLFFFSGFAALVYQVVCPRFGRQLQVKKEEWEWQ
jgi:NADH:ubiquinone oxidoreductase subunit 5 (subunit L)/multisubunit Na+/H+ antiporter MnhA subunit